jgi:hypothetical protein
MSTYVCTSIFIRFFLRTYASEKHQGHVSFPIRPPLAASVVANTDPKANKQQPALRTMYHTYLYVFYTNCRLLGTLAQP